MLLDFEVPISLENNDMYNLAGKNPVATTEVRLSCCIPPASPSQSHLRSLCSPMHSTRLLGYFSQFLPYLCAAPPQIFLQMVDTLTSDLLALPIADGSPRGDAHSTRNTVDVKDRQKGLFGTPVAHIGVVETSGRKSLHTHMLFWGGLQPSVLQDSAAYPAIVAVVQKALGSMYVSEIKGDHAWLHVADAACRAMHLPKRRFTLEDHAALDPPGCSGSHPADTAEPSAEGDDALLTAASSLAAQLPLPFDLRAMCIALSINGHQHGPACHPAPKTVSNKKTKCPRFDVGCRFCMATDHGMAVNDDHVPVVQLTSRAKEVSGPTKGQPHAHKAGSWTGWQCEFCGPQEDRSQLAADQNVDVSLSIDPPAAWDRNASPVRPRDRRAISWNLPRAIVLKPDGQPYLPMDIRRRLHLPQDDAESLSDAEVLAAAADVLSAVPNWKRLFGHMQRDLPARLEAMLANADGKQGNHARQFLKLMGRLPCANGWFVPYNKVLTNAFGCNTAPLMLGGMEQAKAALFYLVKYLTKDGAEDRVAASVIAEASRHVDEHPSRAANVGEPERTAQHKLTRMINSLSARAELSDTQCAMALLGASSVFCSHIQARCGSAYAACMPASHSLPLLTNLHQRPSSPNAGVRIQLVSC